MIASSGAAAAGAAAAAAAAAARREMQRKEEEEMTTYASRDLAEDWEFKILRSPYGTFAQAEQLREVLEEESRAGWVLVEKFDEQRIRLKRPAAARSGDSTRELDPYRTHLAEPMPASVKRMFLIFGVVLALSAVFALTIATLLNT